MIESKTRSSTKTSCEMREASLHAGAAIASLLVDGGFLIRSHELPELMHTGCFDARQTIEVYRAPAPVQQSKRFRQVEPAPVQFVKPCNGADCDAARAQLLPYDVPVACRIEVAADMVRLAADCRRNFGSADDPVEAILEALREMCPGATADELRAVLTAAEIELSVKVARLGGWQSDALGVTAEIETWLELAKGRIHDLNWARLNLI